MQTVQAFIIAHYCIIAIICTSTLCCRCGHKSFFCFQMFAWSQVYKVPRSGSTDLRSARCKNLWIHQQIWCKSQITLQESETAINLQSNNITGIWYMYQSSNIYLALFCEDHNSSYMSWVSVSQFCVKSMLQPIQLLLHPLRPRGTTGSDGWRDVRGVGSLRMPNLWGTRIGLAICISWFSWCCHVRYVSQGILLPPLTGLHFFWTTNTHPLIIWLCCFELFGKGSKRFQRYYLKYHFNVTLALDLIFVSSEYCYTVTNVTVQVCYNKWGPALSLENPEHVSTLCLQRVFVDYFLYK